MTGLKVEGEPARFEVSVVTPVYKAARFVERAVEPRGRNLRMTV